MRESDFFNTLAATWDQKRETNTALINKLVSKIGIVPTDKILDLGSGTGILLPYLAPQAQMVTALDYAGEMLKIANNKNIQFNNITYIVDDIMTTTLSMKYTKIICLNFYPHIVNKDVFLKKIYSLLTDRGQLTIMHDISRHKVNNIHGTCDQVKDDTLAPVDIEAKKIIDNGFIITETQDNDEYYFIQALKK